MSCGADLLKAVICSKKGENNNNSNSYNNNAEWV